MLADEQHGVSHQYFAHQGSLDDPRHIFVCYGRLRRHTFFSTAAAAAATLTIHLGPRVNNAISYIIYKAGFLKIFMNRSDLYYCNFQDSLWVLRIGFNPSYSQRRGKMIFTT